MFYVMKIFILVAHYLLLDSYFRLYNMNQVINSMPPEGPQIFKTQTIFKAKEAKSLFSKKKGSFKDSTGHSKVEGTLLLADAASVSAPIGQRQTADYSL